MSIIIDGIPEYINHFLTMNNQFMKKKLSILLATLFIIVQAQAQVEPTASQWKTWFISSAKSYRLPAPPSYKEEIAQVISKQKQVDEVSLQQIQYWNTGSPGYRWQEMVYGLWMSGEGENGVLANMLVNTAIYDATIVAWDTKYAYKRPRPFTVDNRIKTTLPNPNSPSYPCEHSVAAGVAATIIKHFFPSMADSVQKLAMQVMESRIAAGVAFPSDTRAGFELGKMIAEKEIEHTKEFITKTQWDGKRPEGSSIWKGEPSLPVAGLNKTVILESGKQFRPGPPPDFAKDMEELKKFKPGFQSTGNAFFYGTQSFWNDLLHKKIFEYNIHLNPPRAARIYAIAAIGMYDGFTSCWDAKYAYWGTRPDQYDTTFKPVLLFTPPFPGYPSGHAMLGSVMAELYAYFFPSEKSYFQQKAKEGAESRFQGGIHFRTDNEVGLDMGRKVGEAIILRVKTDGADIDLTAGKKKSYSRY